MDHLEDIDELRERWSEAGGTAAHPVVKKWLYEEAERLGTTLPGQPAKRKR